MNISSGKNGFKTDRKIQDNKTIDISYKKLNNNKIIYKRKSCSIKQKNKYKSRTINIQHNDYAFRSNLSIGNKSQSNMSLTKNMKNQSLINNFKDLIYHKSNYSNNMLLPETSRHNINKKEKYLSNLFWNIENKKNNNNKAINKNNNEYNNIKILSKRNKNKNNINKLGTNKQFNNSYIIKNESIINLENELNYEFEIRLMKKKIKQLQKANNKLKLKLFNIKTEQNRFKLKNQKENLISKVIEIYNGNVVNNKKIPIDKIIQNKSQSYHAINSFKNMLLNIMDWKYNYESKLMIEQFISAIRTIININSEKNIDIINEIKNLLKKRISLKKSINEINSYFEKNKKYKEFLLKLCKSFNSKNLNELEKFLKASFIKYNEEYKEMTRSRNNNLNYNNNRNRLKNSSYERAQKNRNENNKRLIKKNNSVLNININSRNIEKIYELPHKKDDYFTYRENKSNTIDENLYFQSLVDISGVKNQNNYRSIEQYGNISNYNNINSRNVNEYKINIPDYIKTITMHCLRNNK